jgi:NADH:ubiquinone oxidoreductase subunit D
MRQSLRIIEQCINKMPAGEYKVGNVELLITILEIQLYVLLVRRCVYLDRRS